ncbi:MAG TPA: glucans biosynthesis glucosyltransferase MdoH, partial [Polyangiaceae bacterium]|nr:glucans biosynthesis glucosyltransferase MdoH [Polyangiaceae bacterium]
SLMAGGTLVELLRRMERSPRLALLQAPIRLQGGSTLFARATQFASSAYGRLHERGLSRWAGVHGNYYGHNAVLRVSAFLESCALPVLRGEPPLGGHILSHDFVEAALLCRAGWQVELAHDLGSSFEGVPPTFIDYVARDRRWCQGNLQHLRIIRARGLVPMSRIHLGLGAAAYLAGGVWVAFLLLGVLLWRSSGQAFFGVAVPAAVGTLGLLLGPRLLSVLDLVRDRQRRRAHGGLFRLLAGFIFELTLSTALSPLLMLHHAGMVLQIVTGSAVGWRAQRRDASANFLDTLRVEAVPTLLGIAFASALWLYARALLPWLAPVWVPWVLAAPFAWFCSLEATGRLARSLGLLLVPSEIEPDEIIVRANELTALTRGDESARFRDLVLDPVLLEAHLARLPAPAAGVTPIKLDDLCARALRLGPAALSQKERERLSADPASMRRLHREAWQCWPVESWQPARHRPHLPSNAGALGAVAPEARGLRSV